MSSSCVLTRIVIPLSRARLSSIFFFQAEDGIRDLTVTGVQTCALPIFPQAVRNRNANARRTSRIVAQERAHASGVRALRVGGEEAFAGAFGFGAISVAQIGRASCRERV